MGLDGWADWLGRCMDRVYGIRWVDGCIGWTDVLDGRMYWMDGCIGWMGIVWADVLGGWMYWVGGWMDGWMDRWIDR